MKVLWTLLLLVPSLFGQEKGKDYLIYFFGQPSNRTIQTQNDYVSVYSELNLVTPTLFSLELLPSKVKVAEKIKNEKLLLFSENDYRIQIPNQTLDHINIDVMVRVLEQRKRRAVIETRFAYEIPLTAGIQKDLLRFVHRDTSQIELGKTYSIRGIERHFPGMEFQMVIYPKGESIGSETKFSTSVSAQLRSTLRNFEPSTRIPHQLDFWIDYLRTDESQTKILHRQSFSIFRKESYSPLRMNEDQPPADLTQPLEELRKPWFLSSRITVPLDFYGQEKQQSEMIQQYPEYKIFLLYIYLIPMSFKDPSLDFILFVERQLENGLVEGFRKDLHLNSGEAIEIELPPIRDNYVFTDKNGKRVLIDYYDGYSRWVKESIVLKFKR